MTTRPLLRALLALALATCATLAATAAPFPRTDLPEPLKAWVPWVLDGVPEAGCPHLFNDADDRTCVWPGALALTADASGAGFTQEWQVVRDGWVPLPGDAKRWPQSVTVDGQTAPVLDRDGTPSLRLAAGIRRVAGTFAWTALPESLALPAQTGVVQLSLGGQPVAEPVRDDERLWLQRNVNAEGVEQTQVQVNRRVVDGVPLTVETRLRLEVSGKGRELVVGRMLLPGLIPMDLASPLPAALAQDGSLKVQARAGTWDLVLVARHPGAATALALPAADGLVAEEEVWVFQAVPLVRSASVEGPPAVDPQQTTLPPDWRGLPAYLMQPGTEFGLKELRRGDADPAPDKLSLHRRLWLSFDGTTLTLRDRITGQVNQSSRLEMGAPVQLGRVDVDGQDQLITRGTGAQAGIELRRGALAMTADSLVPDAPRRLPAVGWQHDFDDVSVDLALPAGWQLLYAGGADRGQGAWLSRWDLLDLFLVLVTALAIGRLWGRGWGAAAFVLLVLSYHEPGAPRYAWLLVLAAAALARAVPVGRFRTGAVWLERASLLALMLLSLNFAVVQVRSALYPVLAYESLQPLGDASDAMPAAPAPAAAAPEMEADVATQSASSGLEERYRQRSSAPLPKSSRASQAYQAVDPGAKVQTGPGLPEVNSQYRLSWDGPVQQDQVLDLWLLPPWGHQVLVVLRLALLAGLLACLAGVPLPSRRRRAGGGGPGSVAGGTATAGLALAVVFGLGFPTAPAQAQVPDEATLNALKDKLTRPADCLPACAEIARLSVQAAGSTLQLGLDVAAAVETAVPLPGGTKYWVPREARLNGQPAFVQRSEAGGLWLLVPAGTHRIELRGELPPRATLQLPLPLKPRRVEVSAVDWDVAGLSDDTGAADTFQLTRRRQAGSEDTGPPALPPFLRVERRLVLDLVWRVETTVSRASPPGVPALAQVPLLPGEAVTTAGIDVRDGRVLVNLGPQTESVAWTSTLQQAPALTLTAPKDTAWAETWVVNASTLWHVATQGLPPIAADAADDTGLTFLPWPGETLALKIERPQPVAGQTLTVDSSLLAVTPGARATDHELTVVLRSSRGQDHAITLPEQASLQRVSIDGQVRPIRANGRQVLLPIVPGKQTVVLAWRVNQGMALHYATQPVDLGLPSVNSRTALNVPHDRWLLLAGGPGIGPAILFWGTLLVLLGVAVLLGRATGLPVKTWQWMLLAVGLTQVPWWSAAAVVGWFFALKLRRQNPRIDAPAWQFNLAQLGLVVLTLVLLSTLLTAVVGGLLGQPDMQVVGNGSDFQSLRWYVDRAGPELAPAWTVTLPMLAYRGLMLAWALWLAWSLLTWLKWGWQAFGEGGLWRRTPQVQVPRRP